jgi:hypothetical protein
MVKNPSRVAPFVGTYLETRWITWSRKQLDPWFSFSYARPFKITNFYGQTLTYEGIAFSGSVREMFLDEYPQPFLQELIDDSLNETRKFCLEHREDFRVASLAVVPMIERLIQKTFISVARIDATQRPKDEAVLGSEYVERNISTMTSFLAERVECHLASWRRPSKLNFFIENQPFWKWAIPLAATILLGIATLIFT